MNNDVNSSPPHVNGFANNTISLEEYRARYGEPESLGAGIDADEPDVLRPEKKPNRFKITSLDDLLSRPYREEFVQGVLEEGGFSAVFGTWNASKTFLALDIAFSVALGGFWHVRRVKQGDVLYCIGEGDRGFRKRVEAYRKHHKLKALPQALRVLPTVPHVLIDEDMEAFIDAVVECGARHKLIVIDTLARAMAGGNEDSAQDMGRLVAACDRIREATGAHVMSLHHTGHAEKKRARGSSALPGAFDTELSVEKDEKTGINALSSTKQRDTAVGEAVLTYKLEVIELDSKDQWGLPRTSCVVVPIIPPRVVTFTDNENAAWGVLKNSANGLSEDDWRKGFYDWLDGKAGMAGKRPPKPDTKKKNFQRAKDRLASERAVSFDDGVYVANDIGPGGSLLPD